MKMKYTSKSRTDSHVGLSKIQNKNKKSVLLFLFHIPIFQGIL
jgi:hypothetical protein